eukprot:SAG11_NODE_15276_length_583_cov_1.061983_1_plen_194_part_11
MNLSLASGGTLSTSSTDLQSAGNTTLRGILSVDGPKPAFEEPPTDVLIDGPDQFVSPGALQVERGLHFVGTGGGVAHGVLMEAAVTLDQLFVGRQDLAGLLATRSATANEPLLVAARTALPPGIATLNFSDVRVSDANSTIRDIVLDDSFWGGALFERDMLPHLHVAHASTGHRTRLTAERNVTLGLGASWGTG